VPGILGKTASFKVQEMRAMPSFMPLSVLQRRKHDTVWLIGSRPEL
jgi:hypothetical protein